MREGELGEQRYLAIVPLCIVNVNPQHSSFYDSKVKLTLFVFYSLGLIHRLYTDWYLTPAVLLSRVTKKWPLYTKCTPKQCCQEAEFTAIFYEYECTENLLAINRKLRSFLEIIKKTLTNTQLLETEPSH